MGELEQRLGAGELVEWLAYDRMHPIDSEFRNEVMQSIVASTIANCHRGKNRKPLAISDFMPAWDLTKKRQNSLLKLRDYLQKMAKK